MPVTQALYDLQAVDIELDLRNARLAEIHRLLGDDSELKILRKEADRFQVAVRAAGADQADLDKVIAGFTTHMEEAEAKLYGGRVTISRELQDLQADVAMIKRQRGEEEDKLLVVLVALEEEEDGLKASSDRLSAAQSEWDVDQVSMTDERGALGTEVAELEVQRAAQAATVAAPDLSLYERVRKTHAGRAVARLRSGTCDSCRVALPSGQAMSVRTSSTPIPCPNCGLLLLAE
jgi:predicted  nucleic acid-binding Zn-ribbon protein